MGASTAFRVFAAIALLLGCSAAMAGGEVNVFFGVKNVDLDDLQNALEDLTGSSVNLSDLEDLDEFGLLTTWGEGDWPVALAVDLLFASNDINSSYSYYYGGATYGSPYSIDVKLEYDTWEIDVGIRKYWGGNVQFYLGTGLAFGNAEATLTGTLSTLPPSSVFQPGTTPTASISESEKGSDWGLWANTGIVGRLGKHVNLGLDVRFSSINVDLGESDDFIRAPAGGLHYGLYVGGRW
ncbi:MAG: hypothetical protein R3344_00985 [Acidobacteriota bacterium]|nr:hypothetical protein [Acidobacteriota bacterium]